MKILLVILAGLSPVAAFFAFALASMEVVALCVLAGIIALGAVVVSNSIDDVAEEIREARSSLPQADRPKRGESLRDLDI